MKLLDKTQNDLIKFVKECEETLLDPKNRQNVIYPKKAIKSWNSEEIKKSNEPLLKKISGKANIYAIFTAQNKKDSFTLKYIGQTKSKYARTRLTNHLIKKHKKTGAKLQNVIDHVSSGGTIEISWISISPMELRHYVEEMLIQKHPELSWNKHYKKA